MLAEKDADVLTPMIVSEYLTSKIRDASPTVLSAIVFLFSEMDQVRASAKRALTFAAVFAEASAEEMAKLNELMDSIEKDIDNLTTLRHMEAAKQLREHLDELLSLFGKLNLVSMKTRHATSGGAPETISEKIKKLRELAGNNDI